MENFYALDKYMVEKLQELLTCFHERVKLNTGFHQILGIGDLNQSFTISPIIDVGVSIYLGLKNCFNVYDEKYFEIGLRLDNKTLKVEKFIVEYNENDSNEEIIAKINAAYFKSINYINNGIFN